MRWQLLHLKTVNEMEVLRLRETNYARWKKQKRHLGGGGLIKKK